MKLHFPNKFYKFCAYTGILLCIVWSLILLGFLLTLDNGKNGGHILCASILCLGAGSLFYILADRLCKVFPLPQLRYFLFSIVTVIVYTVVACKTPYSPAHDSYDMTGFLQQMLDGEGFNAYATAYLSFTATNKITLFIYYPLAALFRSVSVGTQVLNFILILASIFLISGSAWRMFGEKFGEMSLILMLPFVPYVMLTGPYIYPPSIFITALALFLYHGKTNFSKIMGYISFGLLSILRPTALGFMIVYIIISGLLSLKHKKERFRTVERLILLFVFCVLVRSTTGMTLFYTGLYPYPDMKTSAMMWTSELGTRMQGEETGKCTYSGYSKRFDEISSKFHRLWVIYARANPKDVKTIDYLHKDLHELITERTKSTVLDSSSHFRYFVRTKYKNLFGDEYKPYYYMTNITSKNFGENLYHNYEKRYFLYENILLFCMNLAAVSAGILALLRLRRRKWPDRNLKRALALAAGIMAVFIIFVLMTEVGKRLIFDVFTPMLLLICYINGVLTQKMMEHIKLERPSLTAVCAATALSFMFGVFHFYNFNNIQEFRDCRVQYIDRHIRLTFPQPVKGDYRIWEEDPDLPGGRTIFLKGKTEVILNARKFDRKEIELRLPNGELYMITNIREY